jgi:hypothetical protein
MRLGSTSAKYGPAITMISKKGIQYRRKEARSVTSIARDASMPATNATPQSINAIARAVGFISNTRPATVPATNLRRVVFKTWCWKIARDATMAAA